MRASIIWEKFQVDNRKIITSEEIQELSIELSKDRDQVIDYLQQNGYIIRIFKGIFYVKSLEERKRKKYDKSLYEIIAMALDKKGVKNWYFGLETALKLNTMTHEYFTINYVLTDSYRTTKVIMILDTKFQFMKRSQKYFHFGIIKKDGLRYSDKERTVLDLAYKIYRDGKGINNAINLIEEYKTKLDIKVLKNYMKYYPQMFQDIIGGSL